MYLMYYLHPTNQSRIYTLAKRDPWGNPTMSAHPARFSPDDNTSQNRMLFKRRHGMLPQQLAAVEEKPELSLTMGEYEELLTAARKKERDEIKLQEEQAEKARRKEEKRELKKLKRAREGGSESE